MTRPGLRLRGLAARWCSAKTMARVVDPVIADMQLEYEQARSRGQHWRARRIWIASHVALLRAVVKHGGWRGVETLANMHASDWWSAARIGLWVCGAVGAVTLLLIADPVMSEVARRRHDVLQLAVWVVPSTLPIAIPIGLVVGILQALRHGGGTRASRLVIFGLALAMSVTSFALMAWIIPASNQVFRQTVGGSAVLKGPNELTLGELGQAIGDRKFEREVSTHRYRPVLAWMYHTRWSLSFAPLLLAAFAIAVTSRVPRWRLARILIACVVIGVYWIALWTGERWGARTLPMLAASAPNIAILACTVVVSRLSPRFVTS